MAAVPNDKSFCSKAWKEYDAIAKEVITELMAQFKFSDIEANIREEQGRFDHIYDVSGVTPAGVEIRIEGEVKKDWGTSWTAKDWVGYAWPFNWDTMHIPFRKRDKAKVHATHHAVIGGDKSRLFIVHRSVVLSSPVIEKWCRNRGSKEPFYSVLLPAPQSLWFEKNSEGLWEKVNCDRCAEIVQRATEKGQRGRW